ncbi:MAG: hypothetical protein AAB802_05010 [Patescibacteria group bacterium]
MDILVDWDDPENRQMMELGHFEDLKHLVQLLNRSWAGKWEYRLEKVPGKRGVYLFVEDDPTQDEYECGVIHKIQDKAIALSEAVHSLVMGAYLRYQEEFES